MDMLENMDQPLDIGAPASVEHPDVWPISDSGILKNLEQAREGKESSALAPDVLERLREARKDQLGNTDVIREYIDRARDTMEDMRGGASDAPAAGERGSDFDPDAFRESVEAGADQWHEQLEPNSCAIASQQFIISEYTGLPVTEADLIKTATQMGWYEQIGTPCADVGNLLMAYGIDVTIRQEGDFDDLSSALASGDRVLVAVQNMAMTTEWADGYPAFSANHMVEVLDIDNSDPEDPRVIVNDPGIPNGRAMSMTRENFEDAWRTSGGYMCVAHRPDGDDGRRDPL